MNIRWVVAGLSVCSAGCVVVDGPPKPRPQPTDIRPSKLIPAAEGAFSDTDGNRYRDTSTVVVYVMGNAPAYPIPIKVDGEFTLRLEDRRGNLVAEWKFDKAQSAAAMRMLPPGPGFVFEMDLRKSVTTGGSDRVSENEASLVVLLQATTGELVKARTSAPIQIGMQERE